MTALPQKSDPSDAKTTGPLPWLSLCTTVWTCKSTHTHTHTKSKGAVCHNLHEHLGPVTAMFTCMCTGVKDTGKEESGMTRGQV